MAMRLSQIHVNRDGIMLLSPQKTKEVKPYTHLWEKQFRFVAKDFLPLRKVNIIIDKTIKESDRSTSDEVMYERAHRKMMAMI